MTKEESYMTSHLRMNQVFIRSYLHGRIYILAVSMENVCCLFVDTETFVESSVYTETSFVLSWFLGIHLHRNMCLFIAAGTCLATCYPATDVLLLLTA
jgi:hypothetical protein